MVASVTVEPRARPVCGATIMNLANTKRLRWRMAPEAHHLEVLIEANSLTLFQIIWSDTNQPQDCSFEEKFSK
jgi:hypothetical protein